MDKVKTTEKPDLFVWRKTISCAGEWNNLQMYKVYKCFFNFNELKIREF